MNDINKVLTAAAWRLGVASFLRGTVFALAAALCGLIALRLSQQLFVFGVDWRLAGAVAAGASVLAGFVYAVIVRPGRIAVARRVDEGADLRESLSTALCVAGRGDDPWAKATIESATRQARGVRVSQAVPIQPPKFWPVPLALAMALTVLYFMPQVDVLGWRKKQVVKEADIVRVSEAKQESDKAKQKVEEMVKDLGLEKDPAEVPAAEKPEARDPDAIRKSAIKDLTKLNERLEQLRTGEKSMTLKAVQDRLKMLRPAGQETSELSKALTSGDFSQAGKELEKLKEQIAAGSMSDAQRAATAKELENIAKQLQELAQNKQELEQALQKAGMDPRLAADAKALQQQLKEQAKKEGQSPEQQQQNQQMQQTAQAMSQMQSAMDGLSQSAQQMASACQNPGDKQGGSPQQGQQGQQSGQKEGQQQAGQQQGDQQQQGQQGGAQQAQRAAQQGQQQLSELEQISQEMQTAAAAQQEAQQQMSQLGSQCNGGGGDGQGEGQGNGGQSQAWSDAFSQGQGQGKGWGQGKNFAGMREKGSADFEMQKRKSIGAMGAGPIIGSRLVEGESIKGESVAEFSAAVATAEQGATEAMENNTIPREFHEAVKNYFGNLKQNARPAPGKDAKPAEPAKPAEDAKK